MSSYSSNSDTRLASQFGDSEAQHSDGGDKPRADVFAVNLARMEAVTDDGRVVPIALVGEGAAVARGGPSEWFAIRLSDFSEQPQ